MKLSDKKIAFIGAGKMAEALIKGLISSKLLPQKNMVASDVSSDRLNHLKYNYKITVAQSNADALKVSDIVILCIKPQVMNEVLKAIGPSLRPDQLVISIAAGIRTSAIKKFVKRSSVIRVMPNNPALVGQGLTAVSTGQAKPSSLKIVEAIFRSVGKVVFVPEGLMDAVTALSGSGPAFVYLFAEAFIEGGVSLGLSKSQAETLTIETIIGSARTLELSKKPPAVLREMVTSPGGTTLEGLKVLESARFKNALKGALTAAAKRSKEIGEAYGT